MLALESIRIRRVAQFCNRSPSTGYVLSAISLPLLLYFCAHAIAAAPFDAAFSVLSAPSRTGTIRDKEAMAASSAKLDFDGIGRQAES